MLTLPNVLFRYSQKEFLDSFLSRGRICLRPASYYKDSALTDAQQDDELTRTSSPDTQRYQLAVGDVGGSTASTLGGLTNFTLRNQIKDREGRFYDYYVFCTSLDFRSELYPDFQANACVRIHNPEAFIQRLDHTCQREFGAHRLWFAAVTYFDPTAPLVVETNIDLAFRKDAQKYSHQNEYRFAICLDPKVTLSDRRFIELGDLTDIAQYEVA